MYPILMLLYFPMRFALTTNVKMKSFGKTIKEKKSRKYITSVQYYCVCIRAPEYIIILHLFWNLKRNAAIHDKTAWFIARELF